MTEQPDELETMRFIYNAHKNQVDKGGMQYWLHPVCVRARLENPTETEILVALLHDVIEDTKYTTEHLLAMGYSKEVVDAVKIVSRPGERCRLGSNCHCQGGTTCHHFGRITYRDWIRQIAASGNKAAIKVKLADSEENSREDRVARMPENERGLAERYRWAIPILKEALEKAQ